MTTILRRGSLRLQLQQSLRPPLEPPSPQRLRRSGCWHCQMPTTPTGRHRPPTALAQFPTVPLPALRLLKHQSLLLRLLLKLSSHLQHIRKLAFVIRIARHLTHSCGRVFSCPTQVHQSPLLRQQALCTVDLNQHSSHHNHSIDTKTKVRTKRRRICININISPWWQ